MLGFGIGLLDRLKSGTPTVPADQYYTDDALLDPYFTDDALADPYFTAEVPA